MRTGVGRLIKLIWSLRAAQLAIGSDFISEIGGYNMELEKRVERETVSWMCSVCV